MSAENLALVIEHLEKGTIPDDLELRRACGAVAVFYIAFHLHARQIKEPIDIFIVDRGNIHDLVSFPVTSVHWVWLQLIMVRVAKHNDAITKGFKGIALYNATDNLDVYVTLRSLVTHTCSWCNKTYTSEVNSNRCEASHRSRKCPDERGHLCLDDLVAHWDALSLGERKLIARNATPWLIGITRGAKLTDPVKRIVAVASGDVDISGKDLMEGLDEASERTCLWRMERPVADAGCDFPCDYAAAIANILCEVLAEDQAEAAAEALLALEHAEEMAKQKRQKSKEKRKRRQQAKSKEARIARLEKSIWATPFLPDTRCWADWED